MTSKTPVSILQEMAAKHKIPPPEYDLIFSQAGVNPEFKYQVTFNNVIAVGSGRSKKEAKHNAAEMAITKIKEMKVRSRENNILSGDPVASPYTNQVTRNYVGELADLCVENSLPAALYHEVSAEGPSHAPIFTLSCSVSQFSEFAKASTKKQAKHCVAKKMLQRLSGCLEDVIKVPVPNVDTVCTKMTEEDIVCISQLVDQIRGPTRIACSINELPFALERKYPVLPSSLHDIKNARNSSNWNPLVRLSSVAHELNVDISVKNYEQYQERFNGNSETDQSSSTDSDAFSFVNEIDDDSREDQEYFVPREVLGAGRVYYCILTVKTVPVTVTMAHGSTEQLAKRIAAEEAINHLLIKLSKSTKQ